MYIKKKIIFFKNYICKTNIHSRDKKIKIFKHFILSTIIFLNTNIKDLVFYLNSDVSEVDLTQILVTAIISSTKN